MKKKKSKKFWHFLDIPKKCQKKISFSEISKNRKIFVEKPRSRKCVTEGSLKKNVKKGPFMHGTRTGDLRTTFDRFFLEK